MWIGIYCVILFVAVIFSVYTYMRNFKGWK